MQGTDQESHPSGKYKKSTNDSDYHDNDIQVYLSKDSIISNRILQEILAKTTH